MVATSFVMAASSLIALTYGAPIRRSLVERASYITFGGDGSASSGWPQTSDWKSFDTLWAANLDTISNSCSQHGWGANNDQTEIAAIKSSLQSTASSSGIPASFLLAIMMQESRGCVRVPTTNYGVRNPGLMQDHDGAATCGEPTTTPCPATTIQGMIDQSIGTASGSPTWGLLSTYTQYQSAGGSQAYYKAARGYNSGSVSADGNLGEGVATHCYASDIANRLVGFTGDSPCLEASVASANSASSGYGGSAGNTGNGNTNGNTPTTTTTPVSTSTPTPTTTPSTGNASTNNGATTTNPLLSSTPKTSLGQGINTSTCKLYYVVQSGDTCDKVASVAGTTFATLRSLNTGLDATCSNLWLGSSYCVQ